MVLPKNFFSNQERTTITKITTSFHTQGFVFSPILVEVPFFYEHYPAFQEFMISQFSTACTATIGHWWLYLYTKFQSDPSFTTILTKTLVIFSSYYGHLFTIDEITSLVATSLDLIQKVFDEKNKTLQLSLLLSFETDLLSALQLLQQPLDANTNSPVSIINALYTSRPASNQEDIGISSLDPEPLLHLPSPNIDISLEHPKSFEKEPSSASNAIAVSLPRNVSREDKNSLETFSLSNDSRLTHVQTFNPSDTIHIELPFLHPVNFGEYKDYLRYYKSRFIQLSSIIIRNISENEKKILLNNIDTLHIDQPIFAIGLIEQINNVQISRGNVKTLEQQVQFHCVDPIYQYILVITLEQRSIAPFSAETLPCGIVVGFTGKIIDIDRQKILPVIKIHAERFCFPSTKDISSSTNGSADKQRSTDSYALVVGAVNYHLRSLNSSWQNLLHWLQTPHENYRLKYVFFIGGILPFFPSQGQSKPALAVLSQDSLGIGEVYKKFFSDLRTLPSQLELFFVPGAADITRRFFPQSPLAPKYRLNVPNFHYLSNPGKIVLEDEPIILYNPYTFFWSKQPPYQEKSARLLFDLLEYRLLYPDWLQERHILPDASDFLVIDKLPSSFLAAHPSKTEIPVYSKILVGTVASFDSIERPSSAILYNIKNPSKREIITF